MNLIIFFNSDDQDQHQDDKKLKNGYFRFIYD